MGQGTQSEMIDLTKVIGIFPICNTGAVLVHQIDYGENRVLTSLNGEAPEWCRLEEQYLELTQEEELGFCLGSFLCLCAR